MGKSVRVYFEHPVVLYELGTLFETALVVAKGFGGKKIQNLASAHVIIQRDEILSVLEKRVRVVN